MSAGGGGAALSCCSGGVWARLVTVYFSPASWTFESNTMSVDLSARRLPFAATVVAGYGTGSAPYSSWLTPRPSVIVVDTLASDEAAVSPGGAGSLGLTGARDSGCSNIRQPESVSRSNV